MGTNRKQKIDNSVLKRVRRQQASENRKVEVTKSRQRILIVCEGKKTEPNYFKSLIKELPKGIAQINVIGNGYNTVSLVKQAIKEKDRAKYIKKAYDHVWVVFDKDDFTNKDFNHAIQLATNNKIKCAHSNEAFELWYILHFQYLDTKLNRNQYSDILTEKLGKTYQKNNNDTIKLIKQSGSQTDAIRNAKKLEKTYTGKDHAKHKPKTLVYKLVEKLNSFKKVK